MQMLIQQWGNSLALRIPKAFAQQTRVSKGSLVRLEVARGRMIITPLRTEKPVTLKSLLTGMKPGNLHPESDWGPPRGKENW
jgi:antitoxin MazE